MHRFTRAVVYSNNNEILIAAAIVLTLTELTNNTCYGGSEGSIVVNATGGVKPYTFAWSGGAVSVTTQSSDASSLVTNAVASSYNVSVVDSTGCVVRDTYVVTQPESISAAFYNYTRATCTKCADGGVSVNVSGGSSPYTMMWNNGDTTSYVGGLLPITYTLNIHS